MILTHLKFRAQTPKDQLPDFKMPLSPWTDYLDLIFFLAMIVILLIFPDHHIPMLTAIIAFLVLVALTKFVREEKEIKESK